MKATRLAAAALAVLMACFAGCSKKTLQDGTYTGTGAGRNGDIVVSVTVSGGKITAATILSEEETEDIGKPVEQPILDQFVRDGTTKNIDTVSGATMTTDGLLDALDAAVNAARGKGQTAAAYADTTCDIVIIGAGGAGLVAATEAASHGAQVIVLEKMGIVGGNTNYSTGGINASYTKEQERLGIQDSPEVFYEDTMRGGKYLNDPALVRTLVDNSAATVEWLQSDIVGADLSDVGIFGGATNKRIHRPQGGGAIGAHLVPLLYQSAQRQGADIRLKSRVTDIVRSADGSASGVRVLHDGGEYTITARAVIIASGGFGANPDMLVQYNPALKGFATTNHKGATGDAFAMVQKFDAALTQMEQIQTHPTVVPKSGIMITESVRGNGAILVSRDGTRFVDEMETRDVVSEKVLAQPGATAFLVFDQSVRDSLKAIEDYARQNLLVQADNIQALAGALGFDQAAADALSQTVSDYNGFVAAQHDADFGRTASSMERSIDTAPFYAIEVEPAVHHTMGGIQIDPSARVLTTSGTPVPGLFAAGEVTGGVHGANRLGGNAVADICVFGKIAADSALAYIQ